MPYTETQRRAIQERFLSWCERVGYTKPDAGVEVIIVDGIPVGVHRAVQSIRFDRGLTEGSQDATME